MKLIIGVIIIGSTWFSYWGSTNNAILHTDNLQPSPQRHEARATVGRVDETVKEASGNVGKWGVVREIPKVASRSKSIRTLTMTATAYSYTGNPTKSGKMPRKGLVAADWEQLPKGTKIFVEGYGFAEVADTGGLIKALWNQTDKSKRYAELDVYFPSERDAIKWGRKQVRVHVYSRN